MTDSERAFIPTEDQMRAAIRNRDATFDTVFVFGVITTGVFCLPSCAARPARPENLRFFFDAQHALAAGLRECKRCRPLAAAGERAALIATAEYIAANPEQTHTLTSLAARTELTPSRLQKKFTALFGVSPKQYHDDRRLHGLKASLVAGDTVTDAMHDAGYGSTSRLHHSATRSIGMTPSAYRAGGAGEVIHYAERSTFYGYLLLAATNRGVCFAQFGDDAKSLRAQLAKEFPQATLEPSPAQDSPQLDDWLTGLDDHLSRNAPRPDLPLDLRGTAFQISVWRFLLGTTEGQAISYGELATGIDRPKAVRAAASACGANRVAVLVPCHRVLRGDGSLGGYRWGEERKRALLATERSRSLP